MALVLRLVKGAELTFTELDGNFTYLNTTKYESGDDAQFGQLNFSTLSDGVLEILAFTNDPTLSAADGSVVVPTEYAVKSYVESYHADNPYSFSELNDSSGTGFLGAALIHDGVNYVPKLIEVTDFSDFDTSTVSDGYIFAYNATTSLWTAVPSAALSSVYLDDLVNVIAPAPVANDVLAFDGINWVPSAPVLEMENLTDVNYLSIPKSGESLIYDSVLEQWIPGTPGTVGKLTVSAAKGESISAGRAVTISRQDDRTVAFPIQYAPPEFGQSQAVGNQLGAQTHALWLSGQKKFIIAFINATTGAGEFVLGEVDDSGLEVTMDNTIHEFATGIGGEFSMTYDLATTRVIFAWKDIVTNIGYARVVTVAGLTVTKSQFPFDFSLGEAIGSHTVSSDTQSGNLVFHYADYSLNGGGVGVGRVAEIDGLDILLQPPVAFTTREVFDLHTVYAPTTNRHITVFTDQIGDGYSMVTLITGVFATYRTPSTFDDDVSFPFVAVLPNGSECWVAYKENSTFPARGRVTRFTASSNGTTTVSDQSVYSRYFFENGTGGGAKPYFMSAVRPAVIASDTTRGAVVLWGREDSGTNDIELYTTTISYQEFSGYPIVDIDGAEPASDNIYSSFIINGSIHPAPITGLDESRMIIPVDLATGVRALTYGANPVTNISEWFGIADESFSTPSEGPYSSGVITILGGQATVTNWVGGTNAGQLPPNTKVYIDNSRIYRGSLRTSDVGSGAIGIHLSDGTVLITGDVEPNPDVAGIPKSLTELEDVDTLSSAPLSQQFLQWNTNSQKWVPGYAQVTGQISNLDDVDTYNGFESGIPKSHLFAWDDFNIEWVPKSINQILVDEPVLLNELDDVSLTLPIPVDGDILTYNGPTQKWVASPVNLETDLKDISDVDLTEGLSTGSYLKYDGSNWVPGAAVATMPRLRDLADTGGSWDGSQGMVPIYNTSGTYEGEFTLGFVQNTGSINSLSDVDTISIAPQNGQALVWNGVKWAPATIVSGGSGTDTGGGTSTPPSPAPDGGGSTSGEVVNEDGEPVEVPPLAPDEDIEDPIVTGTGFIEETITNTDEVPLTEALPPNVKPGDYFTLPGDDPIVVYTISEDRTTIGLEGQTTVTAGQAATFATPPVTQVVATAEPILVGAGAVTGSSDTIPVDEPLPEEILPGHAVYIGTNENTPVVAGISADRLTITVSYPIDIAPGLPITFRVVIPMSISQDVGSFVDDDPNTKTAGTVITVKDPVGSGVLIGDYVMHSGLESAPRVIFISVDKLEVTVNKNVDSLVDGQFITFGSTTTKDVPVTISFSELSDVNIESSALQDAEVIVWDYENKEWTNSSIQLANELPALSDVEISNPQDGQVLQYNSQAAVPVFENVYPSWGANALEDFSYNVISAPLDSVLAFDGSIFAATEFTVLMQRSEYTINDISNVSGTPVDGYTLVFDQNTGFYTPTPFPDELTDLSNVSAASANPNDALIYTGSVWTSQEIPRQLSDLNNLNIFELTQFPFSGFSGDGNTQSSSFLKWTGGLIDTVTIGDLGLRLEDLDDVTISEPYNSDFISWDPDTQAWITRSVEGAVIDIGLDVLSDVDMQTLPPVNRNTLEYDEPTGEWRPAERSGVAHYTTVEDVIEGDLLALRSDGLVEKISEIESSVATLFQASGNPSTSSDYFGKSVFVSDDFYIVGAPGYEYLTIGGKVEIFSTATNTRVQTINNPNLTANDRFGESVSISEQFFTIGAPGADANAGRIYVYSLPGFILEHTINNPNISNSTLDDQFGFKVQNTNTFIAATAINEEPQSLSNTNSGTVYLFNPATGNPLGFIENPIPSQTGFGSALALSTSGDLAVGHPNAEKVYVYEAATLGLTYTISNPSSASEFGKAVAVATDGRMVVGAPQSDTGSGKLYVYNLSTGDFNYTLPNPNRNADVPTGDNFGSAVAVTTDYILATAPGESLGSVYLFDAPSGEFKNEFKSDEGATQINWGFSVALTNDYTIIGAPRLGTAGTGKIATFSSTSFLQSNANNWVGVSEETKLASELVTVTTVGAVNKYLSGLTTNKNYYIDGRGFLTPTETDYGVLGKAIAPDQLLITGNVVSAETGVTYINDIRDVDTTSIPPSNLQGLVWDSANNRWTPRTIGYSNVTTLSGLYDTDVSGVQAGQSLRYNGSSWEIATYIPQGSLTLSSLADVDTSGVVDGTALVYSFQFDEWQPSVLPIPTELNQFTDVDLSTTLPSNNDVLVYNTTTEAWEPGVVSRVFELNDLSDVDLVSQPPVQDNVIAYQEGVGWTPVQITNITVTQLDNMDDVRTSGLYAPVPGETLIWNGIEGLWEPGSPALNTISIDSLSDVDTSTEPATFGQFLAWDGVNWSPGSEAPTAATLNSLLDVQVTANPAKELEVLTYDASTQKWYPRAGHSGGIENFIAYGDISDGDVVSIVPPGKVQRTGQDPFSSAWTVENPTVFGTASNDQFAADIAATDDYVIASARFEDEIEGTNSGVVYVFNNIGVQQYYIKNENLNEPVSGDFFGNSLDACGNLLAVGSTGADDITGYNQGAAYVYRLSTGTQATGGDLWLSIQNPDATSAAAFGEDVAISEYNGEARLAVGAPYEDIDDQYGSAGCVYFFDPDIGLGDPQYGFLYRINNPNTLGSISGDRFGHRVSITKDRKYLAVTAKNEGVGFTLGYVYIYDVTSDQLPVLLHTIPNPNPGGGSDSSFGDDIVWDRNPNIKRLAISAPDQDFTGANQGLVYIYDVTDEACTLINTITNPNTYDSTTYDLFGSSIDMKDSNILVGAKNEEQGYIGGVYTNAGKAYYFDAATGTPLAYFDNPNLYGNSSTEYFGSSAAIGGDKLFVGTPNARNTISGDFGSGHLTAFDTNVTSNASSWIGIAFEDILDGEIGQVTLFGGIAHNQINLDPGENYYLNIDGSLNKTPTNFGILGKALSSSDLLITGDVESNTANQVSNLNDLGDVTAFASDGQALVWDAQTLQWVAGDAAGGVDSISDLSDVNLPIPSNIQTGEVLTWNAVSQSFVNAVTGSSNVAELNDLTDVDLDSTLPSADQILQYNGSTWLPQNLPEGQRITGIASEPITEGSLVLFNANGQFENVSTTAGELLASFPSGHSTNYGLFGYTLAEEGGRVVASAPYYQDYSTGTRQGLVKLFDVDNNALLRTFTAPLSSNSINPIYWAENNEGFGLSVAIKDDLIVIGSPLKDQNVPNSGRVRVYRISSGTLVAVLESPEPDLQGEFGAAVAINSNYIVVGAPRVAVSNQGSVGRVYRYSINSVEAAAYTITEGEPITEGIWSEVVPDYIFENNNDTNTPAGDLFGSELSATDTYLAIGAPGEDTGGVLSTGRIYVRNIDTGTTIHTISDPNINSNGLGSVFEIDDIAIVAGTPDFNGGQGRVLIFSTVTGALQETIVGPGEIGTKFGRSVGLGAYQVVVGSEESNTTLGYNNSGKFYIYDRESISSYPLYADFDNPGYVTTPTGDLFGFSVAVTDSGRAVVGAPYNDNAFGSQQYPSEDRGAIFLYDVSTQASASNAGEWVGIIEQTAVTGEEATVVILGGKTSSIYSNLVPGEYYYADATGGLVLNETEYGIVGPAVSTSQILILGSISGVEDMADLTDVDFSSGLVPQHALTWNGQKWTSSFVSTVVNLSDLLDTNLDDTPPEDAQGLVYDSAQEKWVPTSIGYSNVFAFGDLNNVDVGSAIPDQSIKWDGVNWVPTTFSSVASINDLDDVDTTTLKVDYDILTWSETDNKWVIDKRNFGNFLNIEASTATAIEPGAPVYITEDGKVSSINGTETVSGTETLVNTIYPPISNNNFGSTLAINKDVIVVGNPYYNASGILSSGRAYIYSASTGQLLHSLAPITDYPLQGFGSGVATNGSEVAIISSEAAVNNDKGRVYIYDAVTGNELLQIEHPEPNLSTNGSFGSPKALAMTASHIIIGDSSWRDALLGITPGKAYVFNIVTGALEHSFSNPNPTNSANFGVNINIDESESILSISDTGTGSSLTHIYDLLDYSFRTTIDQSLAGVTANKFALNTNYLITASTQNGYMSIWSTVTGANLYTKNIISLVGKDIACNDKEVAVFSGSNLGVKYYDIASGLELAHFSTGSSQAVGAMYKTKLIHKTDVGEVLNYNLSNVKTNSRAADWVGINNSLVLNGDTANITTASGITNSISGLVTGLNYYVSIDGTLFPGPTGFGKIGRAIDSNTLLISSNTSNIDLDEDSTSALIAGINDLTDVDIFSSFPVDNNFLQYDTDSGLWVPGTAAVSLLNDVSITNLEDKNLLVYSTDTNSWQNSVISTNELSDIDYTTPIETGQSLIWDESSSTFKPGVTTRSITSLSDVDDQVPSALQILVWDDITAQWVAVDNDNDLGTLSDVDISEVSNNQFLQYNSVSLKWEPGDVATSIAELTDVNVSSGIENGQYLVYDSNTSVWLPQDLPEFAAAIVDLTDVNADSPVQGQGLIFDDQTNKFELAVVGTSNVDTLDDLSNVSVPSPNNGDVLKYNSNSSTWEATPTPSPAVVYATRALFPALGNLGDLSFAQDTGALYVWEGTVWYNLKRTNAFYLVRAGNFTGPLEGQQVFQPQQEITLHEIRAQVDQPSGETLIFAVMKNSIEVQQFVMPSSEGVVEAAFTSGVTVGLVDEITLDIISGPGTNLSVKFIYS